MDKSKLTDEQRESIDILRQSRGNPILYNCSITIPGAGNVRRDVCSWCYGTIQNTWDHADWCELFEQEPVMKFLEDGIKAKNKGSNR